MFTTNEIDERDSLKLSYYNIFSDPLDLEGNRVLFNTRSNSRIVISDKCYNILLEEDFNRLGSILLNDFIQKNIVIDKTEQELGSIILENAKSLESESTLYEIIQPSGNCQLGCYYCGQEHKNISISNDIADKIIQRIKSKFTQGKYKHLEIGWFGGEPLMSLVQIRRISHALKNFVERANGAYSANMVTNGMSLKSSVFKELAQDLKIKKFELTLDGSEEYHDSHRYTKPGHKSFEIIYKNICDILNLPDFETYKATISIRCNVDQLNEQGVSELIKKIAEDGFQKKITFYIANIYSWAKNNAQEQSLTKQEFALKNLKWEIEMIKAGYLNVIKIPERVKKTCIAVGGESEMYDAYGNIYNCTEVSYTNVYDNTQYVLGNIKFDPFVSFDHKVHNDWNQKVLNTTEFPCHFCKLFPVCGGSCPKSWEEGQPACPPFKFGIKKMLELHYITETSLPSKRQFRLDSFKNSLSLENFQRI